MKINNYGIERVANKFMWLLNELVFCSFKITSIKTTLKFLLE